MSNVNRLDGLIETINQDHNLNITFELLHSKGLVKLLGLPGKYPTMLGNSKQILLTLWNLRDRLDKQKNVTISSVSPVE